MMDTDTALYLLLAVGLLLLNGFYVLAEFALVKVRATRIEELAREGDRRAMLARDMVARLDESLSVTQLGITFASLGLGWVGKPAFAGIIERLLDVPGWLSQSAGAATAATMAFIVITFLHVLIGELAPKSVAIRRAEWATLTIAWPMRWSNALFYFPMRVMNGASNAILRLLRLDVQHKEVAHTDQELRMLLSMAQSRGGLSLNRLLLLENIFDLGGQTVRDAMIPWSRVQTLPRTASHTEVLLQLSQHRYSRTPIVDPSTGLPGGYLLTKDMILLPSGDADWGRLIRPLRVVGADDNLELTMQQLQKDGANMAVVMKDGRPVGLITLEDILEEIVGSIEDEYPRLPRLFLKDAIGAGGIVLDLEAGGPEEAIRKLAAVVPRAHLPAGADIATLAIARERQISTHVYEGVAIPHARCPGLQKPIIVFGRSAAGIPFPAGSGPVHLIFLLITPLERPNLQVFCLAQIADVAASDFVRERLFRARSASELLEVITAADAAVTG